MNKPLERLRHHVSGAIARGEKQAVIEQPAVGAMMLLSHPYLQDKRFTLLLDSQDLASLREYPNVPDNPSGALVDAKGGEVVEMWVTTYRAPYALAATYERVL